MPRSIGYVALLLMVTIFASTGCSPSQSDHTSRTNMQAGGSAITVSQNGDSRHKDSAFVLACDYWGEAGLHTVRLNVDLKKRTLDTVKADGLPHAIGGGKTVVAIIDRDGFQRKLTTDDDRQDRHMLEDVKIDGHNQKIDIDVTNFSGEDGPYLYSMHGQCDKVAPRTATL